jgi:hypothetical protein
MTDEAAPQPTTTPRVWAEERGAGRVLLTWEWAEDTPARDRGPEARAAAATISVRAGVTLAEPAEEGVLVEHDPEVITRAELAAALRGALTQEADLKSRANALLRRAPAYANLARSLALDERVSPVPEAARAAAQRRTAPLRATPLRMIPGFPLLSQLPTLIPVLRSLSSWSRNAPPGVVDEHLAGAGMTREQLDRDLATAHEALAFGKSYTRDAAGKVARKASALASSARDSAREAVRQFNEEKRRPPS